MSELMIETRGLRKSFARHPVLDGVDLEVPAGCVFGFLGLNGAGKTTTIRILLGLLQPDGGKCRVAGTDPTTQPLETRQRVGYMAENQTMYAWMRVGEIISWCGRFYRTWDAELAEALRRRMGLSADVSVGALSKGQTSKLALLLALAQRPRLVILDDPVLGLDPLARRDFLRDVISELQDRAVTVFFSSHLLYEIEPICDRVAILHGGRIVVSEAEEELRDRVKRVELRPRDPAVLLNIPGLLDVRREGDAWSVVAADIHTAGARWRELSTDGLATVDLGLDEIFEAYVAGRKELPA